LHLLPIARLPELQNHFLEGNYVLERNEIKMNNLDMNQVMAMLAKMDKKDLERGIAMANQILNAKNNSGNNNQQ